MRRLAISAFVLLVAASFASIGGPREAHAGGGVDAMVVQVTGSALSNMTSGPLAISPAFAGTTTDYVLRCQPGINTIQLTLNAVPGGVITIGGRSSNSIAVQESVFENQAIVISAPDTNRNGALIQYWIRCLPHDFPQLTVTKPRATPLGWYLTANTFSPAGIGAYAMVLDNNGTPVWYQRGIGQSVTNVTPLADGTIAWVAGGPGWQDYNLATQATRWFTAPLGATDIHELEEMSNGDLMMLSAPTKPDVDLTSLGLGSSATIQDCVLEEVGPNGQLVWEWRASDHISADESTHPSSFQSGGRTIYDIYHCNSIDTDPESNLVLVSARHLDAVYLIDQATGIVVWKMGGTTSNHDHAQILTITGDPEGAFHAQHDARFEPNGDVSLYDNQSWDATMAARGVEYHIDTAASTASLVWSYQSPDGQHSLATGSFRRLSAGADNVIGWGFKSGALFTEVDGQGNVLLNVAWAGSGFAYRVQKVGITALDHELLRATAGLPPFSFTPDTDPVLTASGGTLTSTEDIGFTNAVATFDDPDPTAIASDYLATIAWGDGSSSVGTITGPIGGPFSVGGTHTYVEEGAYAVTSYISNADDPVDTATVTSTVTSTINVADAGLSASCPAPPNSLTSFKSSVATFTDAAPSGAASNYAATIAWGDGSSSPGLVSGPDGGPFTVSAAHSYGPTGKFNITTTIKDVGGSTASASCPTLIYAFPRGAVAFAVGEKSITTGSAIMFRVVPLSKVDSSGDLAPASLKDLWQKIAPTCGIDWATITGNSSLAVGSSLPDYMGVIVISPVRQSDSRKSVITAHILIVRTRAGQRHDSGGWDDRSDWGVRGDSRGAGNLGRGTVEAQVC